MGRYRRLIPQFHRGKEEEDFFFPGVVFFNILGLTVLRLVMCVCMYRGCPSGRCPWDQAFQLGQGEGPIGIVGQISQPRGIIDTASLTPDRTRALVYAFWADFNLGS